MLIDFRELFPKYGIAPKGALHIGANVGEEAPVYSELVKGRVIWVEANEELIPKLRHNISQYHLQGWIHLLLSDVDGEDVNFNISNNAGQSSSILELGTHKTAHPEVHYIKSIPMKTVRWDSYMNGSEMINIDFLNIDVQGAELKVLKGMGNLINPFKWIYLEVNKEELYKGCALVGEIDAYLYHYGFERVETKWCGNTGWGDALYIKK